MRASCRIGELEREAYHVLYPQFGSQAATLGMPFFGEWWLGPVLGLGGGAAGHVVGRAVIKHREKELSATAASVPADPQPEEDRVLPAVYSTPAQPDSL